MLLVPTFRPGAFQLRDGGARAMSNGQSGHSQQAQAAKQQFASERTEFAAERTVLANERTYAAWMRTGLAALRFMKEVLANWALSSRGAARVRRSPTALSRRTCRTGHRHFALPGGTLFLSCSFLPATKGVLTKGAQYELGSDQR